MIARVALFVLMAVGLAGFGTVAWVAAHPHTAAHAAVAVLPINEKVLVAARPLHPGTLLKPADLAIATLDRRHAPKGVNLDTPATRTALMGAMVRHPILKNQPILSFEVMRPGDHGFLAAVLKPGMRAVTVGVDAISGSAGLIWPGDHVDLVLTQEIPEQNLPLGERLAAETVLSDVRVIAIGQQLVQGANPNGVARDPARTVSLEVTPRQAEEVAVATRLGRLSLVVVAADQKEKAASIALDPPSPPSIAWAGQVSPALGVASAVSPHASDSQTMRLFRGTANAQEVHF